MSHNINKTHKNKKYTHDKFLEMLKEKNIDMYHELEFIDKYDGMTTKILAKSKIGLIRVIPSNLLCGKSYSLQSAVNKTYSCKLLFSNAHGDKYDYTLVEYKNSNDKVSIICKEHGIFKQSPSSHIKGKGCPKCAYDKIKERNSITNDEFLKRLKEVNPNIFIDYKILDDYIRSNQYIRLEDEFGVLRIKPNHLLQGKLPTVESAMDKTLYFKNLLKSRNIDTYNSIEILGEYISNNKKILVKDKYGFLKISPADLYSYCKSGIRSAINKTNYWIEMAKEVHLDTYDYSKVKYIDSDSKVIITCKTHGDFLQLPHNHTKGRGCIKCKSSNGEKEVFNFLKNSCINFTTQHSFEDCVYERKLRFDFYLTDYNTIIEYDGIQHFEEIEYFGGKKALEYSKIRDRIKDDYCKENDINIIRIKYDEEDICNFLYKKLSCVIVGFDEINLRKAIDISYQSMLY